VQVLEANATPISATERPRPAIPADAQWIHRHVAAVFRFVRALGAGRDLADDLTQEAFVVAWQKGKHALPPPALATFLRRTARYLWLVHCRRERRAEAAIAVVAERLWEQDCAHDDGERWLLATRTCVGRLRGRPARAVAIAYGEEQSRRAIARELGMQENGVRTLLARTRQWLAECIRRRLA